MVASPVKVLHIGKYFPPFKGGVELYLRDLMVGLEHRGVKCAALVHDHERSFRTREDRLETRGADFRVVRAGVPITFYFTPISPAFRSQIKRLLREFQPDAIHLHLPNPSACWVLSVKAAKALPWLVHWHSDVMTGDLGPVMKLLYRCYRPLEHKLLARAWRIVATSESYLMTSESLRDYPDKCHVVPLGLDPERIEFEMERDGVPVVRSDSLEVLAIGRLAYYKGFEFLIRAAARVPGIHVHIVGKGAQEKALRKLAWSVRASDRVTFHGQLSDSELAGRLKACDCVCLPSIERTEAFGLVLLEAMYFRKATVISDVPGSGMGWVVEHGVTGIKVPPADVSALANALVQLRDDRDCARALGAAGRARFDRLFTIDQSVKGLVTLYNEIGTDQSYEPHEA